MKIFSNSLLVLLVCQVAIPAAIGQDDPARAVEAVAAEALATRVTTQEHLDGWAAERADLQTRWDAARAQVAYLQERVALQRERTEALERSGDDLARRLTESQRLASCIEDTLRVILRDLARVVAHDLPFLPTERARRLDRVRRELDDPGITQADKLRRVFEAVQIEASYGGALEVYQDGIVVDGEPLTCDLLMIGRLALFWLTPDQRRGGVWDPATAAYRTVSGKSLESIRLAMEMATRRRLAGVLDLPLGSVEP